MIPAKISGIAVSSATSNASTVPLSGWILPKSQEGPRPVKWCTRLTASSSPDVHAAAVIAITSSGSSAGSASALAIESALM